MNATLTYPLPTIIQGGMGIGVSDWRLARAVSMRGQLGVVSGTCIDSLLIRRLQDGDVGGHVRRAMERFPMPKVSAEVLEKYFRPRGRNGAAYKLLPLWKQAVGKAREQLTMLASFVEVHLAKEGHSGVVGMNLLTKVQLPNLATLYGAMLAGVDYILMGAGIPKEIPGVLDAFARGDVGKMRLDVDGAGEPIELAFDPRPHFIDDDGVGEAPELKRPAFLPIVSSHSLAVMLSRKANGRVEGFVVEGPTAGGHNAPPRGQLQVNDRGEPLYGQRDDADLAAMKDLGLPFWVAGSAGSPEGLRAALDAGAAGIQVGTLFAFCDESGVEDGLKARVLGKVRAGDVDVFTDGRASPTGFPFKVVELEGSNSGIEEYQARERVCDLGYLRTAYRRPDGRLGFRCAAEPERDYLNKGGAIEDTIGRKCLCNALMANIGHGQLRDDGYERPILTSGNDLTIIARFVGERDSYSADDVLDYLLAGLQTAGAIAGGEAVDGRAIAAD